MHLSYRGLEFDQDSLQVEMVDTGKSVTYRGAHSRVLAPKQAAAKHTAHGLRYRGNPL